MSDDIVDFVNLGVVTAPSGVLVLAMAGHLGYIWADIGQRLSDRAATAAAAGGGHVHEWLFEAVAVPVAADRPLSVRATTQPSPSDQQPTIAILEVELGLAVAAAAEGPVVLGDLPVGRSGMVLGDAEALDSWVGEEGTSRDGLADVAYWGKYAQAARAEFGGAPIGRWQEFGWLDLPVAEARRTATALTAWTGGAQGRGVMVSLSEHTDHYNLTRAAWDHPLLVGAIDVAGCRVIGIGWDPGDHSMRHRGERLHGQVYPVTITGDGAGGAVMRWTIPPYGMD